MVLVYLKDQAGPSLINYAGAHWMLCSQYFSMDENKLKNFYWSTINVIL